MPTLKTGSAADYDAIPNDEVLAVALADVEVFSQTFKNDKTGEPEETERLRWSFIVTEPGAYEGRTVSGLSSTSFVNHPNCKAYNWASVLLGGRQFEAEETLNTDDLIGKPARAHIKQNEKNGRVYENVVSLLQARSASSGGVAPPEQTGWDESPF